MKKVFIVLFLIIAVFLQSCIIINEDADRKATIYVYNRNSYQLTLDIFMNGNRMFTLEYFQNGHIKDVPVGTHKLQAWWWNPYYEEWELEAEKYITVIDSGDYHWFIE